MQRVTEQEGTNRRRYLAAVSGAVTMLTAGCTQSANTSSNEPPCADAFEITEESIQLGGGVIPEIELQFANVGPIPIGYDVGVIFKQGTSLGKYARTGRAQFAGTLAPEEARVIVATSEGPEIENTDIYELNVELDCGETAISD